MKWAEFVHHIARLPAMAAILAASIHGTAAYGAAQHDEKHQKASAERVEMANLGCSALKNRVASYTGVGALFLRSYETTAGKPLSEPALRDAAFTYDNALAVIALISCGEVASAERIGAALRLAIESDRAWSDGRVRNAYRAGVPDRTPLPNGWWDERQGRWLEDGYQVGTATGNVAWAALALLNLADITGDDETRKAAARALDWVLSTVRRPSPVPNAADLAPDLAFVFIGGFQGHEPTPIPLTWVATEHAIDLVAAFTWMNRLQPAPRWQEGAAQARHFIDRMWEPGTGRFRIGLTPDGTVNEKGSGLDAQLWPLLAIDMAPESWRRSLDFVERAYGVDGGVDFNEDRDGLWVEGTAQAALAFAAVGQGERADGLLAAIRQDVSPGGLLFASRNERMTTGLAIGPDSVSADFFYYRHGHLGATAWAVLAANRWNPFTGKRLPD